MEQKHVKLIHTTGGHNKYYEMIYPGHGSQWTASYGRIGSVGTTATYPMVDWKKKYNEKIKKGYVDVSENKKSIEDILADLDRRIEEMENREILEKALN